MELKRGWWKCGDVSVLLVGEHNGKWYGLDENRKASAWSTNFMTAFVWNYTYCGDGPEPVEPVQLGLGWWERMDGGLEQIIEDRNDGPFRWANRFGSRWNDKGQFSRVLFDYSDTHSLDIVRRRPDLDAKEAAEQAAKPDPRDAEIERWKTENAILHLRINQLKDECRHFASKANSAENENDLLKNERNDLRRILGDH
jgi:hypothetical protein